MDTAPAPPVAKRISRVEVVHGDRLVDDYAWLRDKDDPDVLAYLRAENAYTDAVLGPTEGFQEALYQEMLARIKEDDQTVPYRFGRHLYYARTEKGKQYPLMCRRAMAPDAPEEITLDLNVLAKFEMTGATGSTDSAGGGEARQRGILGPALAGGRVAITAGDDFRFASLRHDLGQRAMRLRLPVRRVELVVDARQRVFLIAARKGQRLHVIELHRGLRRIAEGQQLRLVDGKQPVGVGNLRRRLGGELRAEEGEDGGEADAIHDVSPGRQGRKHTES